MNLMMHQLHAHIETEYVIYNYIIFSEYYYTIFAETYLYFIILSIQLILNYSVQ